MWYGDSQNLNGKVSRVTLPHHGILLKNTKSSHFSVPLEEIENISYLLLELNQSLEIFL